MLRPGWERSAFSQAWNVMAKQTRRGFLDLLIGGLSAAFALGFAGICGAFLYPPKRTGSLSNTLTGPSGQAIEAKSIPEGGSQTGRLMGRTVIVVRQKGSLHALSAECTHAGCLVSWNSKDKHLDCPCHGARYDIQGNVLRPPAPRPLPRLEIEIGPDGLIHAKGAANAGEVA